MKEGHSDMLASHKQMGKKRKRGDQLYIRMCVGPDFIASHHLVTG